MLIVQNIQKYFKFYKEQKTELSKSQIFWGEKDYICSILLDEIYGKINLERKATKGLF